jgi:hypothetical protein
VTDSSRFLLYKDYQSGLSNEILSAELAVGLAHLTGRTLVFYGNVGEDRALAPLPNILMQSPPSRRDVVDPARTPTVLDLLDELPVATMSFAEFRARASGSRRTTFDSDLRLPASVFVDRAAARDRESLADFAGGRTVFSDRGEDVFHLKEINLGYYSRIFHAPSASFHATMRRVGARAPYRNLAAAICRSLGRFNGVHVRLNDFRKFLPYRGLDYPQEILRNLAANLPADELLVISTDESENAEFFAPIVAHFRRHVFVDQLVMRDFRREFRALPFSDEVTLGWISNLVLGGASEFLGTPGSTFSGLIQRRVALAQAERDLFASPQAFKFTFPGSVTMDVPFEDGIYLETRPGRYSWNRLGWAMEEETKSWYREWPEAIPERRTAEVERAAPAEAPPRFTMSTSFAGAGVPPQLVPGAGAPQRRAIERQIQDIACDLMFGAERASLITRLMALGAPAKEARRIIETAYDDPLIVNGRAMALVLRKRDWLLEAMERQQRLWPAAAEIERRSGIGGDEFLERYYSRGRPVILAGAMAAWLATKKWTPDYLGATLGRIEVEIQSESLLAQSTGAARDRRPRMPFDEFVRTVSQAAAGQGGYMLADETRNAAAAARLRSDLGTLDALLDAGAPRSGGIIWLGSSGVLTPLHHDLVNCLIAQVAGRNRLKIIAAGEVDKIYNHQHVLSEVGDLEAPGIAARYPALAGARIYDVTLEPGEILFMPLAWWYQVRSSGFGASVTYTNFRWPNDSYRSYPGR